MFIFSAEFQRWRCVCVWIKIQCQNKVIQEDEGRCWAVMWAQLIMAVFSLFDKVINFPPRKVLTFPLFTHFLFFCFCFPFLFFFLLYKKVTEVFWHHKMSWGLRGRWSFCLKHWMLYHLIIHHFILITVFQTSWKGHL